MTEDNKMSRRAEFEAKYEVVSNRGLTTDEYLESLGFTVSEDGEILDAEGKGTGFWYDEIEY